MVRASSQRKKRQAGPASEGGSPAKSSARRVLLTGASGFIGRRVLALLRAEGYEVVAVARRTGPGDALPGVIQVAADLAGDSWLSWAAGCSAAIHLVGIIREVPRQGVTFDHVHRVLTMRVVEACHRLGIPRLIHMSALGARPDGATAYQRTKFIGEELVRSSGLRWTIFRPSLVFGPGDGFERAVVPVMRRLPIMPVFGDGQARLQPVAVDEVAHCFVAAIERGACDSQIYDLGGPEALTYDEVLLRMARALGLRRRLLHLPVGLSRVLVAIAERFPSSPITRDQLTMLLAGSTCDIGATSLAFGVPRQRYEGPVWLRPGALATP